MPEYLAKLLSGATSNPYDHALAGFIGGIISGIIKHGGIGYAITSGVFGSIFAFLLTRDISIYLGLAPSIGGGFIIGFLGYKVAVIVIKVDWVSRLNRKK
jgi:hypothetical protein